jgi:iron complex outermembrane receptor protein
VHPYTDAKLTSRAPGLVGPFDALSGARLPGHAKHQGAVSFTYDTTLMGYDMAINYDILYASDVFNIVGGDRDPLVDADNGDAIPGYGIHNVTAMIRQDNWTVPASVENLLNKEYITGTRTTRRHLQNEQNGPGVLRDTIVQRSYANYVGAPRSIGLRLSYDF